VAAGASILFSTVRIVCPRRFHFRRSISDGEGALYYTHVLKNAHLDHTLACVRQATYAQAVNLDLKITTSDASLVFAVVTATEYSQNLVRYSKA
jgi:hypothetical protein